MIIEAGTPDTCLLSVYSKSSIFPSYSEIMAGVEFKVVMELDGDYVPFFRGEEIYLKYYNNVWFGRKRNDNYNFLRSYKMPKYNASLLGQVKPVCDNTSDLK